MTSYDRPALAPGPAAPFSVELAAIWDVAATPAYDIHYGKRSPDRDERLIVVRTFGGCGEMTLRGQSPIQLRRDTLMLVRPEDLARYRCAERSWRFWWFSCKPSGPLPVAPNRLNTVKGDRRDDDDFAQVFSKIQHPAYPVRCVASALFSAMLLRWIANAHLQQEPTPHRRVVETMIERIHLNVGEPWSGPRLAQESGLSESAFRSAFKQATGQSPARFIREARLQAAYQMCRRQTHTLAAIADELHFSSPFHLSAAFKKHFGINPSEV